MRIAFIRPDYPDEQRVALLPGDVAHLIRCGIEPVIELGFGATLHITDDDFRSVGAVVDTRANCYKERAIFNLKETQPGDYGELRPEHVLIGWTHPYGPGADFYRNVSAPLGVTLLDMDSVYPRIFKGSAAAENVDFFPRHAFWKNSYNSGIASVRMALQHFPLHPNPATAVCILGSGSVAQGAFYELSKVGFRPRMFYRKTMDIFRERIAEYDIIVNGIEVDTPGVRIMDEDMLRQTRENVAIIEAAADAGNAIEGTEYQRLEAPIAELFGRRYLMVSNAPTLMAAEASRDISAVVARDILPAVIRNRARLGL